MANTNFPFPWTLGKPETQTLGESVIGSFTLGCIFGELSAIFPIFHNGQHQFSISMDTQKAGDPNFRGVGNWEFCSSMHFWGAMAIFPIFHNGQHQLSMCLWTLRKPETQTLGVSSNWEFHSRMRVFVELRPFFPFSVMANINVPTLRKLE